MERRFISEDAANVGLEERDGEPVKIQGYGAVYYDGTPKTEYRLWPGAVERILPGAFDRAIQQDDVRGLYNHNVDHLLGRTSAGTMKLESFQKGLRYTIKPPDTTLARDVIANIRAGNLSGSSFGFTLSEKDEEWSVDEGRNLMVREIRNVSGLFDTGPVTFPAYTATSVGLRAAGEASEARASFDMWQQKQADAAALSEKLAAIKARAAEISALQ